MNRRHAFDTGHARAEPSTIRSASAISPWGRLRWCLGGEVWRGSAAVSAGPAGSSVRWPSALAQRMPMPSRVRSLRAVSGLSCQTGRNTRARSLVVI